jgi:methionyl-tRNA synthetase
LPVVSFYLTTPIYYVNSSPHVGHAYTTIAADILARHRRQRGEDTFFLTGTDEHGSNIARIADERGQDPKAFVDEMAEQWRELPRRVNASNDFFIRTTDREHERFVQDFLQRMYDRGEVYEGTYSGLYCLSCESFYTEAELVDGRCPIHGTEPQFLEEKNWFFRLSAYQEPLLRLYEKRPDFVLPRFRYNEAKSFIERGLDDISVTRATQRWGVPLPWDPDQVVYVWVDALINYMSALTYGRGEDERPRFWPATHVLAKDILKFHCVIWPALLMAADYEVPRQLFVHGYLLFDDRKMSKTLGNVVDPLELIDVYGVDALRFYLVRATTFGQDGNISLEGVHERYERELGNDLGNLLSRTTAMIARYRDGQIPAAEPAPAVAEAVASLGASLPERLDAFDLTGALDAIWGEVRRLNRYVEEAAPWELAKDEARQEELDGVLYTLVDGLRAVAVTLSPYIPDTAARILAALAQPEDVAWENVAAGRTATAAEIEPAAPLFPRVDAPTAAA